MLRRDSVDPAWAGSGKGLGVLKEVGIPVQFHEVNSQAQFTHMRHLLPT